MAILKFKPISSTDVFKGNSKTFSTQKLAFGENGASGQDQPLQWFMIERGDADWSKSGIDNELKHLFASFGLAREDQEEWFRSLETYDWYNAKRMLIASIPQSGCGSYIDGSTIKLRVPTGTGSTSYDTFYGATFNGVKDTLTNYVVSQEYSDLIYGGAAVYLFPEYNDIIAASRPSWGSMPYSGLVNGRPNPNSGITHWTGANTSNETFYPHIKATNRSIGDDGGDVPYGIALLDKGLFVIFDMYGRSDYLINNDAIYTGVAATGEHIWSGDGTGAYNALFDPVTFSAGSAEFNSNPNNRNGIYFSGTNGYTSARLIYRTVTSSYKTIYFCHAGQGEFNSTTNNTYNHRIGAFRPENATSIWVTEIGLYDESNTMMAYAKLSEPVEKSKLETLTFKVSLEL